MAALKDALQAVCARMRTVATLGSGFDDPEHARNGLYVLRYLRIIS